MRGGGWSFGIPANKQKVTAATNNTSVHLSTRVFPPGKRNYHLETGNSRNHHDPGAHLRGRGIDPRCQLCWALCGAVLRSQKVGTASAAAEWAAQGARGTDSFPGCWRGLFVTRRRLNSQKQTHLLCPTHLLSILLALNLGEKRRMPLSLPGEHVLRLKIRKFRGTSGWQYFFHIWKTILNQTKTIQLTHQLQ